MMHSKKESEQLIKTIKMTKLELFLKEKYQLNLQAKKISFLGIASHLKVSIIVYKVRFALIMNQKYSIKMLRNFKTVGKVSPCFCLILLKLLIILKQFPK